jgi:hypothetical protein
LLPEAANPRSVVRLTFLPPIDRMEARVYASVHAPRSFGAMSLLGKSFAQQMGFEIKTNPEFRGEAPTEASSAGLLS